MVFKIYTGKKRKSCTWLGRVITQTLFLSKRLGWRMCPPSGICKATSARNAPWSTRGPTKLGNKLSPSASYVEGLFNNKNLKLSTRVNVYKDVWLSTLPYGSETWPFYRHQIKKLNMYHNSCLQGFLGVTWRESLTHDEIPSGPRSNSMKFLAAQIHLWWMGHIIRMEDSRLHKQDLHGELSRGQRLQREQKSASNTLWKQIFRKCHKNFRDLKVLAQERAEWRRSYHRSLDTVEKDWRNQRDWLRQRRHERRTTEPTAPLDTLMWHHS